MIPERDNILPEALIGIIILLLFYVVAWFFVKPSFSNVGNQVHELNSQEYFQIASRYIILEDIDVEENTPLEITLGELKNKGYIGDKEDITEYVTIFSKAGQIYSDDSKIVIVKKGNDYEYSIRLCPSSETTCDQNSEVLLDTIK